MVVNSLEMMMMIDCRLIGGAADGGPDRNPAREAKRQRDYLKDYFNNEGAVAWQYGRI